MLIIIFVVINVIVKDDDEEDKQTGHIVYFSLEKHHNENDA
jgi:hypothetical protein